MKSFSRWNLQIMRRELWRTIKMVTHGESDRGMFGFRESEREKMKENLRRVESCFFLLCFFLCSTHMHVRTCILVFELFLFNLKLMYFYLWGIQISRFLRTNRIKRRQFNSRQWKVGLVDDIGLVASFLFFSKINKLVW
jgi:hypothetical protein